jgi:hypothetical protein
MRPPTYHCTLGMGHQPVGANGAGDRDVHATGGGQSRKAIADGSLDGAGTLFGAGCRDSKPISCLTLLYELWAEHVAGAGGN